jgi:prevent-host-death family protein
MPTKVVKSGEARAKFRDLLDYVLAGKGDVVIERNGKKVAVLIPAADYAEPRGASKGARVVRESQAAYKTVKVGPAIINAEEGTATIPLDFYNELNARRERLFDLIREIQNAQPDIPPEEVERDVAEAIEQVRRRNASRGN